MSRLRTVFSRLLPSSQTETTAGFIYPDRLAAKNLKAVPIKRRPTSLTWVYRRENLKSGTIMRGAQLAELARSQLDSSIDVHFLDESEAALVSNAILILTPSIANTVAPEELNQHRSRGNVICVDFLDYAPREDINDCIDVYISSSIRQEYHFLERFPDKEVHRITHHADLEIGKVTPPLDRCRIGYFGEVRNALHRDQLLGQIAFIQTNNSENRDRSWLSKVSNYNCHYSVREYSLPTRNPPPDAFKPFTKGFTAAKCGCNIIVPFDESDAAIYLGSNYPYLLKGNTVEHVREMIERVKLTFGGPEWRRGLIKMEEVQHRSSPSFIAGELKRLIHKIAHL